jgi:hypothetical protein
MRLEHKGVVEAQPVYGHVGYCSAAFTGDTYRTRVAGDIPYALFGASIAACVVALALARHAERRAGMVVASALVGLGAVVALSVGLQQAARPVYTLAPEFGNTLVTLQKLVAETDAWVAAHGRAPSEAEWLALHQPAPVDGWGWALEYRAFPGTEGGRDHRTYEVSSVAARFGQTDGIVWDIPSWWLGRDGRLGSADDWRTLTYGLQGARDLPDWQARAR